MPGIVGLQTRLPRDLAEEKLLQMLEVLRHESFYVDGTWVEESLGLYVGWVERKGAFSEKMPLRNETGKIVLIFSGEEFPEVDTGQKLKERGHDLTGSGPGHLVHLYEEDPNFPGGLNGRFHGVLIDRDRKSAFLFNDRYGMHRIYYHHARDGFYFAAEAKAILAVVPETRRLDFRGVGEFVACGCPLEGRTLFDGVHVLEGGSKWILREGSQVKKRAYFSPKEWENQEPLEAEPFYRELREVFSRNLPRYFRADEPIGMSLTGGLDTRMLMAWQRCPPGSLPCYTFGGEFRDCQDVVLGRRIARTCGQPHEVIKVGREFLSEFSQYAERCVWLSDGCVDVSRSPDLYLNERAREIAPVRMSGVYGGEVLRGVRTFKPEELHAGLFAPEFGSYLQQAQETYESLQVHPVSFAVFTQAPWSQYGILALEETQLAVRCPFLDNDLVRTVFRAPAAARESNLASMRLISEGKRELLQIPTDRGLYGNGRHRLEGNCRHAVLEFLFKAEYAYDIGMPQWLAAIDHAFSAFQLERLFLGRHKIFHFRTWYRDALAGYIRDMLLDSTSLSRSYINRKTMESMVRGHLDGNRNYSLEIHKLLGLELVHRLFLDAVHCKHQFRTDSRELLARLKERGHAFTECVLP